MRIYVLLWLLGLVGFVEFFLAAFRKGVTGLPEALECLRNDWLDRTLVGLVISGAAYLIGSIGLVQHVYLWIMERQHDLITATIGGLMVFLFALKHLILGCLMMLASECKRSKRARNLE